MKIGRFSLKSWGSLKTPRGQIFSAICFEQLFHVCTSLFHICHFIKVTVERSNVPQRNKRHISLLSVKMWNISTMNARTYFYQEPSILFRDTKYTIPRQIHVPFSNTHKTICLGTQHLAYFPQTLNIVCLILINICVITCRSLNPFMKTYTHDMTYLMMFQ